MIFLTIGILLILTPTVSGLWYNDVRLTFDPTYSFRPVVGVDNRGDVHIVWENSSFEGLGRGGFYYSKLDNESKFLVKNKRITSQENYSTGWLSPSYDFYADNSLFIIWGDWLDEVGFQGEIYYAKLDNQSNFLINSSKLTGDTSHMPQTKIDSNGNAHIVWLKLINYSSINGTFDFEVFYSKMNKDGNILVSPKRLSTISKPNWDLEYNPYLVIDSSDNVYVLRGADLGGSNFSFYFQKLDNNGVVLIEEKKLGLNILEGGFVLYLGLDSSGNINLIWDESSGSSIEVYYAKINNTGSIIIDKTNLTSLDGKNSQNSHMAIDQNDTIHVVWDDERSGEFEVYYKEFNSSTGSAITNETKLTANSNKSWYGNLGVDTNDNVFVTWADFRHGISEIYLKKNKADSTPPFLNISSPENKTYYNVTTVDLEVSTDESIDTWKYSLNGANKSFNSATLTYASDTLSLSNGSHEIIVYANDSAGNLAVATRYLTLEFEYPNITIYSPQNTTYTSSTIPLNVAANKIIDTWIWQYNGNDTNFTFTPNITFYAGGGDGLKYITLWANDTAGLGASSKVYFTIDTMEPIITVSSPGNKSFNTLSIDLNVTTNEEMNPSAWEYRLEGGDLTPFTPNQTITVTEGAHNLIVFGDDLAGNRGPSSLIYFTVDITPPSVTIVSPANMTYTSGTQVINASITDALLSIDSVIAEVNDFVNVTLDRDGSTNYYNTTYTFSGGTNSVNIYANDSVGNMNSAEIVYFTMDTKLVSGVVYNSSANIPNANVSLVNASNQSVAASAVTNSTGGYNTIVPSGTYYLYAENTYHYRSSNTSSFTVTANLSGKNIEMTPLPGMFDGYVNQFISSTNTTNYGISGATVYVKQAGTTINYTTTDSTGMYMVYVPAGTYDLYAVYGSNYAGWLTGQSVELNGMSMNNITVTATTYTVSGTVSDSINSSYNISGATVTVDQTADSTTTNSNGYYTLTVANGSSYTLTVTATNYNSKASISTGQVTADTTKDISLTPENGSIIGTVSDVDETGIKRPAITVTKTGGLGSVSTYTTTASTLGTYVVTDVVPWTTYNVTVDGATAKFNSSTGTTTMTPGGAKTVYITLANVKIDATPTIQVAPNAPVQEKNFTITVDNKGQSQTTFTIGLVKGNLTSNATLSKNSLVVGAGSTNTTILSVNSSLPNFYNFTVNITSQDDLDVFANVTVYLAVYNNVTQQLVANTQNDTQSNFTQSVVIDAVINTTNATESMIIGSVTENATLTDSVVKENSTVNATVLTNATVEGSTVTDATITESTLVDSTVENGSTVQGSSTVEDSVISQTTVSSSAVQDSNLTGSTITGSTVVGYDVVNVTITSDTLKTATVTAGQTATLNTPEGVEFNLTSNTLTSDIALNELVPASVTIAKTDTSFATNVTDRTTGKKVIEIDISSSNTAANLVVAKTKIPAAPDPIAVMPPGVGYLYLEDKAGNLQTAIESAMIKLYYDRNNLGSLTESSLRVQWYNGTEWRAASEDDNNNGILDVDEMTTATTAVDGFDGYVCPWNPARSIPGIQYCGINTEEGYVFANVTHLSVYGIAGSVDGGVGITTSTIGGGGSGGSPSPVTLLPAGAIEMTSTTYSNILISLSAGGKINKDGFVEASALLAPPLLLTSKYPLPTDPIAAQFARTVERITGDVYTIVAGEAMQYTRFRFSPHEDEIVIARGDLGVDSMAALAYAKTKNVPVLLVKPEELPTVTEGAIDFFLRVGKRDITIIGGPVAVSQDVEQKLGKKTNVKRIYGETRIETAVALAEEAYPDKNKVRAVVITDYVNPKIDAVLMSYLLDAPLLYVKSDGLSPVVKEYILNHKETIYGPTKVVLMGVSPKVASEIDETLE